MHACRVVLYSSSMKPASMHYAHVWGCLCMHAYRVVQYYGKDRIEVREKLLFWRKKVRNARRDGRIKKVGTRLCA